jgi:hypothetical protein
MKLLLMSINKGRFLARLFSIILKKTTSPSTRSAEPFNAALDHPLSWSPSSRLGGVHTPGSMLGRPSSTLVVAFVCKVTPNLHRSHHIRVGKQRPH